jgi:predicted transcriptional regulator of viral defense system
MRGTKGTISVGEAADILGVPRGGAAKMLSRWARKGWVSRVRRGLYVAVPVESSTPDVAIEDPWIIAVRLFEPCYIGGWTAAEHWGLTEQIFADVVVMTTGRPRDRRPDVKGVRFHVRTVQDGAFFGLKTVWRANEKVSVSDPSRTIVDMLAHPGLGGGIRPVEDIFRNYLASEQKALGLVKEYATRLRNGAVFKRLGFLMERLAPGEEDFLEVCRELLTKGNAALDPELPKDRLISKWRLWVPRNWTKGRRGG